MAITPISNSKLLKQHGKRWFYRESFTTDAVASNRTLIAVPTDLDMTPFGSGAGTPTYTQGKIIEACLIADSVGAPTATPDGWTLWFAPQVSGNQLPIGMVRNNDATHNDFTNWPQGGAVATQASPTGDISLRIEGSAANSRITVIMWGELI